MPEAQFSATGTWGDDVHTSTTAPRRAAMTFTLALATAARCSSASDGRVCAAARDRSLASVVAGSPFSPDYAKMTGQIKVAIDSGQFLKAEPGAARS
jgi:uncharacterized protein YhdP